VSGVRDAMFELLDAVVDRRWTSVNRLARKVEGMANRSTRDFWARKWVELHGPRHPEVAAWIEKQIERPEPEVETIPTRPFTVGDIYMMQPYLMRRT
jgi:hypothetical protein